MLDYFNLFKLFIDVRWIGYGCTMQKGRTPIFVESLINSFKLLAFTNVTARCVFLGGFARKCQWGYFVKHE